MMEEPVTLDLMGVGDPVSLLDRTLLRCGGVVRTFGYDGSSIVYFHPTAERLREFHRAEQVESLRNYNTPAAEELFARSVFIVTGDHHRRRRGHLVRSLGTRGRWREQVDTAISSWIRTAIEREAVDLLDETRRLAMAIFARVVFGVDPDSAIGKDIARLAVQFVAGAVAAAGPEPDRPVLESALDARDELARLFTYLQLRDGDGSSVAQLDARDLGAVLIASIETTANLLGWAIIRWLQVEPPKRIDPDAFARQVEALDSPNTLITREVAHTFQFGGSDLEPGTLIGYSPASAAGEDVTFGSGPRACPGKALAQYIVRRALAKLATSSWSLEIAGVPHPRSWFPVRTFGPGTLVRTASGPARCR